MNVFWRKVVLACCKFICSPFTFLPPGLKKQYALLLTRGILLAFPRSNYIVHRNLQLCLPDLSFKEREEVREKMIRSLSNNLLGHFKGTTITQEKVLATLDFSENSELVQRIKDNKGIGYLFLVPHYGPFELISHYWALHDKPLAILARDFGFPEVNTWWNAQRESTGNIMFSRKGGFKELVYHLESGTNVAILFDQNVKRSHGIFAPFFGLPASTSKTIALASLKTSCEIVFATMIPKIDSPESFSDGETYKLVVKAVTKPEMQAGTREEKMIATITEVHGHLEDVIREKPEHWFWLHRRFKTRPQGEPEDWYDSEKFPISKD